MEKLISSAQYASDHICRTLLETLEASEGALHLQSAVFYYDFPSFRDYDDESFRPNVMLLSSQHGVVALSVCDGELLANHLERADEDLTQFFSILFGRLIKSRVLRQTRNTLALPFHSLVYAPGGNGIDGNLGQFHLENELVTSFQSFSGWLDEHRIDAIDEELLNEARSIIEGAKALTKPKARDVTAGHPKANILSALEAEVANFDAEQRKAAITMVACPQRIRGLAGTGKTIVLAMKAAQLHLNEPTKRVLYTFYTKSLYDLIRRLITRFYRHYKDSDPDWSRLQVLHAWGGTSIAGVYHSACIDNGAQALRWSDVSKTVAEPFNYVCGELLKTPIRPMYDCVLIDEGQDLPANFFRLCYFLTVGERDEKQIVWAYDELQNIFNVKVRSPRELFGAGQDNEPLVDLERGGAKLPPYLSNDIVLHKSYRNPKEILVTAHALGFGLYSEQIVQMLENQEHWEDVGYQVLSGSFVKNTPTIVLRPDENSPLSISKWEAEENIIQVFVGETYEKELAWVGDQIVSFVKDGLRPEDILVVSLDDRNARSYFDSIRNILLAAEILCNNVLDNPFTISHFAVEGKVTLSTVHRAKGNEAAAVLAVGIHAVYPLRKSRTGRNRIFTAFTRAKAWLRVSGSGPDAEFFMNEVRSAKQKSPRLEFSFPDLDQVNLLQRDMGKREMRLKKIRDKYKRELEKLGLGEDEMAEFFTGDEKK